MPGRMLTQAHSRRSTSARPAVSASTMEGHVVYTKTARCVFMRSVPGRGRLRATLKAPDRVALKALSHEPRPRPRPRPCPHELRADRLRGKPHTGGPGGARDP